MVATASRRRGAAPLPALALGLALALLLVLPATASAWPGRYAAVAGNPADRLRHLPIEEAAYDPATRCTKRPRPGTEALVAWLDEHAAGESWGSYRCEKWGRRSASLHAENRAVDWHLDAASADGRREATRLIALLLAPDRSGNAQALARRMGVEEIIWDCRYWSAGMDGHRPYSPCLDRRGRISRRVNKTLAHRDHLHIGLTRAGAAMQTSFWQAARARR